MSAYSRVARTAFAVVGICLWTAAAGAQRGTRTAAPPPTPPPAPTNEPEQTLTAFGGGSGNSFNRRCADGKVLVGLRGLAGLWMDAVGVICSTVNSNGTLGAPSSDGSMAGGTGGSVRERRCDAGKVVTGIYIRFDNYVSNINVECRNWDPATKQVAAQWSDLPGFTNSVSTQAKRIQCTNRRQPGAGIHGRANAYLDAIGMYCDEP